MFSYLLFHLAVSASRSFELLAVPYEFSQVDKGSHKSPG
jgi:hypothetical protein